VSSPRRLHALDLAAYAFETINETKVLTSTAGGQVHGVVFWFDAELIPGVTISNSPAGNTSHWMQAFACFEQPVTVAKGDDVAVQLTFSQRSVDLSYLGNGAAARRPSHTGT
jgi:type II protein arginine methyltransferase